jgi:hypothetical protein
VGITSSAECRENNYEYITAGSKRRVQKIAILWSIGRRMQKWAEECYLI